MLCNLDRKYRLEMVGYTGDRLSPLDVCKSDITSYYIIVSIIGQRHREKWENTGIRLACVRSSYQNILYEVLILRMSLRGFQSRLYGHL